MTPTSENELLTADERAMAGRVLVNREHLLTPEQVERSNEHIAAACQEIRKRLGPKPRNVNGEGSQRAKPTSRLVMQGHRGGTYSL